MADTKINVVELDDVTSIEDDDTLLLIRKKTDGTREAKRIDAGTFKGEDAYAVAVGLGFSGSYKEWEDTLQHILKSETILSAAQDAIKEMLDATEKTKTATELCNIATIHAERSRAKCDEATANATEIAQHPTYIGEDFYVYVWDTDEKLYKRTDIYVKGEDAFDVAVHAGYSGTYDEWVKLISDWSMAGVIDLDDIYNLFNNK